jgi:hypothetical protein
MNIQKTLATGEMPYLPLLEGQQVAAVRSNISGVQAPGPAVSVAGVVSAVGTSARWVTAMPVSSPSAPRPEVLPGTDSTTGAARLKGAHRTFSRERPIVSARSRLVHRAETHRTASALNRVRRGT